MQQYGTAIKEVAGFLRRKRGDKSLAEFARFLELDPRTLRKYEQGKYGNLSLDKLEWMVKRLKACIHEVWPCEHAGRQGTNCKWCGKIILPILPTTRRKS